MFYLGLHCLPIDAIEIDIQFCLKKSDLGLLCFPKGTIDLLLHCFLKGAVWSCTTLLVLRSSSL